MSVYRGGAPQSMPWKFVSILNRLIASNHDAQQQVLEENGIVAVLVSINAIEAFTNNLCTVIAHDPKHTGAKSQLLKELKGQTSVYSKVKVLSESVFIDPIDFEDLRWSEFRRLKEKRNRLVHFKSSHDTVHAGGGLVLEGLASEADLLDLNEQSPASALACVIGFVELIGESVLGSDTAVGPFIHIWLGIVQPPSNSSKQFG